MKQLTMTQDQRNKLWQMCIMLFPEFITIRYGRGWEKDYIWMDNIPNNTLDPVQIHWFELCMTELPDRLYNKLKKLCHESSDSNEQRRLEPDIMPLDVLDLLVMGGRHPIDTLYGEYKKLKNATIK